MKRLVKRFSFITIALATALLAIGLSIPLNSHKVAVAFEDFALNKPQTIKFQNKADSLQKFTTRQKKNQFLDWLLFTIESDRSFSTQEISEASYDIAPVRYDYLKPISNFEYGDIRSLYVGKDTIVALIPQDVSSAKRIDYLAHIADKHRQNLGRIPDKLEVFEYQLDLEAATAQLTRVEELKVSNLFEDQKYGYYRAEIKNIGDLKRFMAKVDDITFTEVVDSNLVIGGRKIHGYSYGKISVEDVAALWQSEKKIKTQPFKYKVNGSGFSLDPAFDYQGLQESLTEIEPQLLTLKSNGKHLFNALEIEGVQQALSKSDRVPYLKLVDKLQQNIKDVSESANQKINSEIEQQIAIAKKEVDKELIEQENQLKQELERTFDSLNKSNYSVEEKNQRYKQKIDDLNANFQRTQQDLINQKKQEIDRLAAQKESVFTEVNSFLATPRTGSFQMARYDGDLQGTEVGMVLYYTDLLAKLWVLDYLGTTPEKHIADFQPLTKVSTKVSSIYEQESQELPNTRLWFGPQDKGFQISHNNNNLLFARNATRIFAASSNPLEPGKENTARADSDAFLRWWDEHYEEIARYEPQYERLNQIMKWSLVISWLNKSERGESLGFLQGVKVNHDNWFPDWVQANIEQLKFKEWDTTNCSSDFYSAEQPKVCFYPRGYQETTTEAMPLLSSKSFVQFGKSSFVSGGVSLGDSKTIADRTPLSKGSKIRESILRGNIDNKSINRSDRILSFKTLDGATYDLKTNQPIASITAKAHDRAKLRNLDSELTNIELARQISRTNNGIAIDFAAGDTKIGSFKTFKTDNAFIVGWRSRDIDLGQSLALELSLSKSDPVKFLDSHAKVNSLVIQDGLTYYVKIDDAQQWLKLESASEGDGDIPAGWTSQVASSDDSGAAKYLLAWVNDSDVETLLSQGKAKQVRKTAAMDSANKNQQFFADLENGRFEKAAAAIADDPTAFIKSKKAHLSNKLNDIDGLIQNQNYLDAIQATEDSIDIYGQQPDLMNRKAVVNLK